MQYESGSFYHVYNRTINQELLFKEEINYSYFLKQFQEYLGDSVDVYSYCLMPNHFHFFIKAVDESAVIETNFKNFFISYAKSINKMFSRKGSLFQAKYKKDAIADDKHFTNLIAYINLNPVKAHLCNKPEDWKFSSYNAIMSDLPTRVKREEIINWFGDKAQLVEYHKCYYQGGKSGPFDDLDI